MFTSDISIIRADNQSSECSLDEDMFQCLKFKLIKAALQTIIWFVIKQLFMVTFTVQRYLSKTVLWLQSNSSFERSGDKMAILNWTEYVKIY